MLRMWKLFLAWTRLSKIAVCEMSLYSDWDFHDYPDSTTPEPVHMHEHVCFRCGKHFGI